MNTTTRGPMDPQTDVDGRLRHLLSLQGLSRTQLETLLRRAQGLTAHAYGGTGARHALAGKAVCTLFFEPSTRTRSSFSLAAQRLGADLLGTKIEVAVGDHSGQDKRCRCVGGIVLYRSSIANRVLGDLHHNVEVFAFGRVQIHGIAERIKIAQQPSDSAWRRFLDRDLRLKQ